MAASGPRASRTLRKASRELAAVNFFTFIFFLRTAVMFAGRDRPSIASIIDDAPGKPSEEKDGETGLIHPRAAELRSRKVQKYAYMMSIFLTV
jgi:hypothetical protein